MTQGEAALILSIPALAMPNMQGKDLTAPAATMAMLLPDVTFEEGKTAIVKIMRERKIATLPLPGEILEAVKQLRAETQKSKFPTAFEAWEEVCKKLDPYSVAQWSHPIIGKAVSQTGKYDIMNGSWGVAERFVKIYNVLVEREKNKVEIPLLLAIAEGHSIDNVLGISDEKEVKRIGKVYEFNSKVEKNNQRKENVG